MAVTSGRNPKAAKRGTYTIEPPSNAYPKDENGDVIVYQYQPFPKMVYGADLKKGQINSAGNPMIQDGPDMKRVYNDFELQRAIDEGWRMTPVKVNGTQVNFEEEVVVEVTPEKPRKKPGPKPKAMVA